MSRPSLISLAPLALAACAAGAPARRSADLSRLIQLRGTTITLLQSHAISVREARAIQGELDSARRDVDAGDWKGAAVWLDAVQQYLASRQGKPL